VTRHLHDGPCSILRDGEPAAFAQLRAGQQHIHSSVDNKDFVAEGREAPQWGTIPTVSEPAPIQQGRA